MEVGLDPQHAVDIVSWRKTSSEQRDYRFRYFLEAGGNLTSGNLNIKILVTSSCAWDALDNHYGTDDCAEPSETVE